MADIADSKKSVKPFPPPPEEPIRIFCPQKLEGLREAWREVSDMPNIEWGDDWSKCKIMIFICPWMERVSKELAEQIQSFFKRDGRESLVYEFRPDSKNFVEWDREIFSRNPWRVVNAS